MIGCQYPIIGAPMFLVSNVDLVVAVSEAGGAGATPSLNWRKPEEFHQAIRDIKAKTNKPFGVNLIVNKANPRTEQDLKICAEEKVPFVITSLGSPREVIEKMHAVGSKVFCDVTTLHHAEKVQALGADGVVAVCQGAGGHAGEISPLVFIPYLQKHLKIPIIAAGGITTGAQMKAVLTLGAAAAQIGTRFIASTEAPVDSAYKDAILNAEPQDIVMTLKLSGTPAAVIKTPYVEQQGTDLPMVEKFLLKNERTKKVAKIYRMLRGQKALEKAAKSATWKQVWSAGQGVGLIDDVISAREIVARLIREYEAAQG